MALWSFMIALHLFNLLFLRWKSTLVALVVTLVSGWTVVAVIIFVGPGVIQTTEKGPYFGVSGSWCWITDNYPHEQVFLEYFFVSCTICNVRHSQYLQCCRSSYPRASVFYYMLLFFYVSEVTWLWWVADGTFSLFLAVKVGDYKLGEMLSTHPC
jgi:hypothetical protein